VAAAVAKCRGGASMLDDREYDLAAGGEKSVAEAFRALRGARVNVGEAGEVVRVVRAAAQRARRRSLRTDLTVLVVALDPAQCRLLRVLLALERAGDCANAHFEVRELKRAAGDIGGHCDVVVASVGRENPVKYFGLASGGATPSARADLKALRDTVAAARFAARYRVRLQRKCVRLHIATTRSRASGDDDA
jgi:hypothetical protein